MRKEITETFTYAIGPKLREAAIKRAMKEGVTLSEIIRMAIAGYVEGPEFKDFDGNVAVSEYVWLIDPVEVKSIK